MKKILSIALLICLVLTLCACGKKAESVTASDQSKFTWQIQVNKVEVKDKLHTDAGVPQYDGGITDVAYDNAPAEGNAYVILTMVVTKGQAGGGSFDWKKLSLKDADGNSYARSYYYDELGRLYFAYYSGTDSHRCYFYEGQLFRWRYMQDASDAATAVNHDLENSAAFSEQQTLVQQDSDAFLSEAAALMGTG